MAADAGYTVGWGPWPAWFMALPCNKCDRQRVLAPADDGAVRVAGAGCCRLDAEAAAA